MNKRQINYLISQAMKLYRQRNYPMLIIIMIVIATSLVTTHWDGFKNIFSPGPDQEVTGLPNTPNSFTTAKRLLYTKIYQDRRQTFYCGCDFSDTRQVKLNSCQVKPRKNKTRALRTEAEHVVPAAWFGQNRRCWQQPLCTDSQGKSFKGRSCCEQIDTVFQTAHNDLHNLMPAVGEINGDRRDYAFGLINGEAREYGQCDIEINTQQRQVEPAPAIRGNIARIFFYMEKTYGVDIPHQQRQLLSAWDKADPVDAWERERDRRIAEVQGNHNPFVTQAL